MQSPNNYFLGTTRTSFRPCECCNRPVKVDEDNPEVYGSGRFCSQVCAKLRTPEKHYLWTKENPEDHKKWDERKTKLEQKEAKKLGVSGTSEVVFPVF